jgi:hypothetical protein
MSGPHLSDAARRAGPTRQRVVAAWSPRTTPMPWLKAAVETARRASRQLASPAPPTPRQRLAAPARLPTVPYLPTVRAPLSEDATPHCPSVSEPSPLPGRLRRREHDHGEHRPSSSLTVLRLWSVELTLPSLLTVAGPPPATVAPLHWRDAAVETDFFSSASTRSSGELAFRPPCPSSSLTVANRAGRGRPSERRPRPHGRGPCTRCVRGPSRRRGREPRATVHLGRAWFRPRGTQIDFLFSEYIQFLTNSKNCVGFI